MRSGSVFYKENFAGIISETADGDYIFKYDKNYVDQFPNDFLTFTMPVCEKIYIEKRLFSFFDGLIPEGWLLEIASKNWKINQNDRMGLLLACCQNCIGAVTVKTLIDDYEK